ncbi:MAG: SusD/RagB family nutrient-binding outer membrane lipoprotein [Prevotella sp.]|nr:SusD/RagB family nutrient-binding outer membrane lipoprotein [Prevotella sp.]
MNNKQHPWEGTLDPRLYVYTTPNDAGVYQGIPYATPTGTQEKFSESAPDWYSTKPMVVQKTYAVPLMTYAELKFILCEYNGYDVADYKDGVEASLKYWYDLAGKSISNTTIDSYVNAVSGNVNAETCALQKYIDLYTNGTEAWTEIRRTGYPEQLIRPGEITCVYNGNKIAFTPLSETKGDIIERVKYPTNESTLNGDNWKAAVAKLADKTNNYYSKMYWDVRASKYNHPANK